MPLAVALDSGAAIFPTTTVVDFLPEVHHHVAHHRCVMLRRRAHILQHPPPRRAKCRSGFTTLPPVQLQEPSTLVLLLRRGFLISWSLDMDEHSEYEDLRGLGRQSVILYVHERIKLYCSSLTLPA
jgi:hypothetical protein